MNPIARLGMFAVWVANLAVPTSPTLVAQQIGVSTPFSALSDGYYERMGVNFGGRFGSVPRNGSGSFGFFNFGQGPSFSQGSFGPTIPAFGGYDPGSSARFGFGQVNPNGSGYSLNFEMGKGSTRSFVSQAPSVTVQNGFGGSIFDGSQRPFVTSVTPVIGGGSNPDVIDNGVTRALSSGQLDLSGLGEWTPEKTAPDNSTRSGVYSSSTASTGEKSVKAILAEQNAAKGVLKEKIDSMRAKADEFISDGNFGQARLQLKRALALEKDTGRRSEITAILNELGK